MQFFRYVVPFLLVVAINVPEAGGLPVSILTFGAGDSTGRKQFLGKSITEMVTVDLVGVQGITLIERSDMEKILKEQALSLSGAFDESEVPQIGKLIGAKYLVYGTYTVQRRRINVTYKISEVETGVVRGGATVSGRLRQFMALKNKLAGSIYSSLRSVTAGLGPFAIPPADATISVDDAENYGKALDFSDRGEYENARTNYPGSQYLSPMRRLADMIPE